MSSITRPTNWGSNYRSLYERNQILLNNEELSDVQFQFEDETVLFAHKFILASRSPVFEKMFIYCECNETLIRMESQTANIFFKFLQYLYTDDISWLRCYNVGPVMCTAHKYGVNHLEELCYNYMSEELNIQNACTFLEHCHLFSNKFTEKLFSFIDAKCEDIILQQSFSLLSIPALLCIVKRETLVVRESHLFKQLLDCTFLACKNTRPNKEAKTVFDHIRFPTMNICEFSECLRVAPNFFTEAEKVSILDCIRGSDSILRRNTYNLAYPNIKREWKLVKQFLFNTQVWNCTEGNKTFAMRFRTSKVVEVKEIVAYESENCSYYVQLIDGRQRAMFSVFFPHLDSYTVTCSLRLQPDTVYTWKSSLYCTSNMTESMCLSQGSNQNESVFSLLGKGRSVVKKIKFIEK